MVGEGGEDVEGVWEAGEEFEVPGGKGEEEGMRRGGSLLGWVLMGDVGWIWGRGSSSSAVSSEGGLFSVWESAEVGGIGVSVVESWIESTD